MAINISLYVHGVPKGQKIWGLGGQDRSFIELFYGRFKDLKNPTMLVETNGSNSYYTYLVTDNVLAKDGRAGAYIALTVCVNAYYYADVVNMYNVLDAAYNKFLLGTVAKSDGTATRFLIEDFEQVDNHLKQLNKELVNYLLQFSSNNDFVGLTGFPKQLTSVESCNLADCNRDEIARVIKKVGGIFISPSLPSNAVRLATKKKDEEIAALKADKQKAVQAVKDQYVDADRTISKLKTDLATEQDRNNGLKNTLTDRDNKIALLEKQSKSTKELQKEVKECREIIDKHERTLSDIGDIANKLSTLTGKTKHDVSPKSVTPSGKKPLGMRSIVSLSLSLVNTILLIVLLALFMPKSCSSDKGLISANDEHLKQQIDSLEKLVAKKTETLAKVSKPETAPQTEPDLQQTKVAKPAGSYGNAYIDASGYNGNLKVKGNSTLTIKKKPKANGDIPPHNPEGQFVSKNPNVVTIDGKTMTAVAKGTCEIQYIINGKAELTKSITVVE